MTDRFFSRIPKVELHVHLEGSVRPETLLTLAARHGADVPVKTIEEVREWYRFRDFPHFVEVYVSVSKCIRTADDLELVAREFLKGQADQNILHTELTVTASTLERYSGIPWRDQERAMSQAIGWAQSELDISCGLILDIVRGDTPERALEVCRWALESPLVVALGLAGEENRGTAPYREAFELAHSHDLPVIPHAGETCGPESIRECLDLCRPPRIGHGVRCLESPSLTLRLLEAQTSLEVCPTSNVKLGIFPSLSEHPLPRLLDEGLYVTVNSDDPPMFGTTLTEELSRCSEAFDFSEDIVWTLCLNSARAALLSDPKKQRLLARMREEFCEITAEAASL